MNKRMSQGECNCCYARGGSRTKSCKSDPGQEVWIPGVRCNLRLGRQDVPRTHRSICGVGKGLLCQQSDCVADCTGVVYIVRMSMEQRVWSMCMWLLLEQSKYQGCEQADREKEAWW